MTTADHGTTVLTVTSVEADRADLGSWQEDTDLVTADLEPSRAGSPNHLTFFARRGHHRVGDRIAVTIVEELPA